MIIDTPDTLKDKIGLSQYNYTVSNTYVIVPKKEDYDRGHIKRYFVGRINYTNIIETDAKGYKTADSRFFIKITVDWKITGPEYNVYNGKILELAGVVPYNNLQITFAKKTLPNIETVLNNPRQFWRGY